jgi:hypothetical protein
VYLFNTLERELIMAITTALCKPENVIAVSSPLNGGLMEKIPPQVVHAHSLLPPQHQILNGYTLPNGLRGLGGDA